MSEYSKPRKAEGWKNSTVFVTKQRQRWRGRGSHHPTMTLKMMKKKELGPKVSVSDRFEALFVERCRCPGGPIVHDHCIGCPVAGLIVKNGGSILPIKLCKLCKKEGTAELCFFCWNAIKAEVVERNKIEAWDRELQRKKMELQVEEDALKHQVRLFETLYGRSRRSILSEVGSAPRPLVGKEGEEEELSDHHEDDHDTDLDFEWYV